MAIYRCVICATAFHIPDDVVAHFRRWQPKYCAAHAAVAHARSRPFGDAARTVRARIRWQTRPGCGDLRA